MCVEWSGQVCIFIILNLYTYVCAVCAGWAYIHIRIFVWCNCQICHHCHYSYIRTTMVCASERQGIYALSNACTHMHAHVYRQL